MLQVLISSPAAFLTFSPSVHIPWFQVICPANLSCQMFDYTKTDSFYMQVSIHTGGLTLGRRLHGDLVAEIALTRSGHSCSPDQVLLPVAEVCDSVEQQLRIGFILTGELSRSTRQKSENLFFLFRRSVNAAPLTILQLILFVVRLEYANLGLHRQSHYSSADPQSSTTQVKAAWKKLINPNI